MLGSISRIFLLLPSVLGFTKTCANDAEIIIPNLWINVINPLQVSIMQDIWLFKIPLNLKPSYVNMQLDWDNITFADFHNNLEWNVQMLNHAHFPWLLKIPLTC